LQLSSTQLQTSDAGRPGVQESRPLLQNELPIAHRPGSGERQG
jgi:hypothetical protein